MKRLYVKLVLFALSGVLLAPGLSAERRQNSLASKPASTSTQDMTALKAMGSREAPITIEVFSDYQCPQCRVFIWIQRAN